MAPNRKRKLIKPKEETKKETLKGKSRRVSHPFYETPRVGYVLAMGQGDVGQLGLGDNFLERKKPTLVKGLEGINIVQVTCGGMHTLALSDTGTVYSWGCNDEGALGRQTENKEGSEYVVDSVKFPEDVKVVQLSAGDSHSAALLENGTVFVWGTYRDANGPVYINPEKKSVAIRKRYPVDDVHCDPAVKIASGNDHTVILTECGDIFTLGSGEQGQLGRVMECFSHRGGRRGIEYILLPQIVRFRSKRLKFVDIYAGSFHTFAIEKSGDIYTWGLNNYGQLGIGNTYNQFAPAFSQPFTRLLKCSPEDGKPCARIGISGGQHHSIAVSESCKVFSVGRSEYGRLGTGENAEETAEPLEITELKNVAIKQVACGEACSFAVSDEGLLYSWGLGTCLQLGNGEEEDVKTPYLVKGKFLDPQKHEVVSVDAGGQHTIILARDKVQNGEAS